MKAHTNRMTGFRGIFLVVIFSLGVKASVAGRKNPLVELSTHTDLIQLAGYGLEKLSSVLVTGTLLCEACLHGEMEPELRQWPISGAVIGVACKTSRRKMSKYWARGKTDEYGEFIIDLPSQLHAIPELDKACSVKVVALPKIKSACSRAFVGKSQGIRLSSVGNGIRTYTAGEIAFQKQSKRSSVFCLKKGKGKTDMQGFHRGEPYIR
ncbi:PREDICTED: uncharacterized protein LOC104594245 [Nelumbo nucifera]|uniref:Uncharacterized protein LOC104594245 n=1 Tax=Nelumbo nucifera TaxID=4432 RepID=A0A1U7ZUV0_NELNU|nr:PREDICTED: uncharacterized protein LOC104594245 [Nelumbo nucifera]